MKRTSSRRLVLTLLLLLGLGSIVSCIPLPNGQQNIAKIETTSTALSRIAQSTRENSVSTTVQLSPTRKIIAQATTAPGSPTRQQVVRPTKTKPPEAKLNLIKCDQAAPGSPIDVTIPDDKQMAPGQPFTKVWRLVNAGSCNWSAIYTVERFSGARLGSVNSFPIGIEVRPGDSIDISVDMAAPQAPGAYQSNWKLRNQKKEWFGIGPDGDQAFWVKIMVIEVFTGTPFPSLPPTDTPTPSSTPTITPTHTIVPILTMKPTITQVEP